MAGLRSRSPHNAGDDSKDEGASQRGRTGLGSESSNKGGNGSSMGKAGDMGMEEETNVNVSMLVANLNKASASMGSNGGNARRQRASGYGGGEHKIGSVGDRVDMLEEQMARMSFDVGQGDYSTPLGVATARGMLTLDRRVAQLEGSINTEYKVRNDHLGVIMGEKEKKERQQHLEAALRKKRMGQNYSNVGPAHCAAAIGWRKACVASDKVDGDKKKYIAEYLGGKGVVDNEGNMQVGRIQIVAGEVGQCKIKIHREIAYVTWFVRDSTLDTAFHQLFSDGTRNYGPPPTAPNFVDIRNGLVEEGYLGKGKGKGKGKADGDGEL